MNRKAFICHIMDMKSHSSYFLPALWILVFVLLSEPLSAQDTLSSVHQLKRLSIEELMDVEIEVFSVSRRPEKLAEVASAVQVITGDDIHRSSVTRLPEALRLVSNLQVSQANSHDWAITARGFNGLPSAGGILANKLLVMVDGRSIYNPLFGGVYWDVQNVLMEDLDRIEVVSGPGGALWGANAVNGVINITTKSARETQGLYVSGAGGSFLRGFGGVRYGTRVSSNVFARAYMQHYDQTNTELINERSARDAWKMTQAGFRVDYDLAKSATLTFQGDFYAGDQNDSVRHTNTDGQNVSARFAKDFSDQSNLIVQAYFDRTWRRTPESANPFYYDLNTFDVDIQHRVLAGRRQSILWGISYQLQKDNTAPQESTVAVTFNPRSRSMPLFSGFLQDEISVVPDLLKLTIGSKFLHNIFSGFEIQPSVRMAWTPNQHHTLWTAFSRAVRTPTRFDSDLTGRLIEFDSEKVLAYELGYRIRPADRVLISVATFYNKYLQLRSIDTVAVGPPVTLALANSQRAESWGIEFSGTLSATEWWRLRTGYTYFEKNIWPTGNRVVPVSVEFEGVDPKSQFMVQSMMDLPHNLKLDLAGRYRDALPAVATSSPIEKVPAYFTFDIRLAWQPESFEISIVGQNLLKESHTEAGLSKIPRTFYGKFTCRF